VRRGARPRSEEPASVISRRQLLLGVGALGCVALGLEGLLLEPNRLSPTRHRIGTPSNEAQTPIRLTALTDLHLHSIGRLEEAVAAEIVDYDPDAVLVIGDAVDQADALGLLQDFLGLLPGRTPEYATLGNWEYWSGVDLDALGAAYDRFGGRLLVNESVRLPREGTSAELVGVDDFVAGQPDLSLAGVSDAGKGEALILSHCPAYRDALGDAERPIAAMLSGHTHGGQIALGPWAPVDHPGPIGDHPGGCPLRVVRFDDDGRPGVTR